MLIEEMIDLQCRCGGMLLEVGNVYRCDSCGRRYCIDCGGSVITQENCDLCLSCAASSCAA